MIPSCDFPSTSKDSLFDSDGEFEFTDSRQSQKQKHLSGVETPAGIYLELRRSSRDCCFVEDYKTLASKTVPSKDNVKCNVFSPEAKEIRSKIKDLELL